MEKQKEEKREKREKRRKAEKWPNWEMARSRGRLDPNRKWSKNRAIFNFNSGVKFK